MAKGALPDGFKFADLSNEEFRENWDKWGPEIFHANSNHLNIRAVLSDEERVQIGGLHQKWSELPKINIGIFKDKDFCGWFTGEQFDYETFYMRNSAILPQYRRKGLYTALMSEVLKRTENMGFQIVTSHHKMTNNSIIIPKLKAGFVISGIEVSDRFGTHVRLSYFFNAKRRKAMDFRVGDLKTDSELSKALSLK